MYVTTVTISFEGQMVLPDKVRNSRNTNIIFLIINDQNQVLKIHELGALSFMEIREQFWNKLL